MITHASIEREHFEETESYIKLDKWKYLVFKKYCEQKCHSVMTRDFMRIKDE